MAEEVYIGPNGVVPQDVLNRLNKAHAAGLIGNWRQSSDNPDTNEIADPSAIPSNVILGRFPRRIPSPSHPQEEAQ